MPLGLPLTQVKIQTVIIFFHEIFEMTIQILFSLICLLIFQVTITLFKNFFECSAHFILLPGGAVNNYQNIFESFVTFSKEIHLSHVLLPEVMQVTNYQLTSWKFPFDCPM